MVKAPPRAGVEEPVAVVIGNLDLIRPLVAAGIPCAAVASSVAAARYSSLVSHVITTCPGDTDEVLLDKLLLFARDQPQPPTLFYELDDAMLLVSRHRDVLVGPYRVLVDESELVEACADKVSFRELAERTDLPVPASQVVHPASQVPGTVPPDRFPVVVKPRSHRDRRWSRIARGQKAILAPTAHDLGALWPALASTGDAYVVQALIPGPETRVESHHAYVDADGAIVAEFTGRKIRTLPRLHGQSTALETTDATDVTAIGRDVIARLGLRGVVKLDFKRDEDGRLWLLEVNPRLTLWTNLGAVAGVNLPALVHADLTDQPRPPTSPAIAGVTWFHPSDLAASREWGVPLTSWIRWAGRCDARSIIALDDPLVVPRVAVARAQAKLRGMAVRGRDRVRTMRRRASVARAIGRPRREGNGA